jgi:hypothetical protein
MTTLSIQPPFPAFTDIDGQPLENGYVFVGTANLNPVTNPISVFWDAALTQPAAQPVRTLGGYPMNSGTPARLYVNSDYSIQVQNSKGSVVYSAPAAGERFSSVVVPLDAADISFTQAGTGAQVRTVQTDMREEIKSSQYDTLQNAVTAASGKRLRIIGAYTISTAVSVPANTYIVAYAGEGTVTQSASGQNAFTIAGDGVVIDGVTIVGGNVGSGSAIRADARLNVTVKNCTIKTWRYGIQLRSCKNYQVLDNRIWGGTADGTSSSDVFIYGNTGAPSNRGVISGNFCLSNNDNGISVGTDNGDREISIADNVVYPLGTDGSTPLADAANFRRYGIVVGYNGGNTSRVSVTGNVVRDVAYSGIYIQSASLPAGDVNVTGNNVTRCGFGTTYPSDASLRSGILLIGGGGDTVTGNVVNDCETTGIKIAPNFTYTYADQPRQVVANNVVRRTLGTGILFTNKPHGYLITGNRVINSTVYNVYYETTTSDGGNCHFVGNHIDSDGAVTGGFVIDNTNGGTDCSVSSNKINGFDNTTNNEFNSGIWFKGKVHITDNVITKFHRGVNCADTLARVVDRQCSGNTITNCVFGVNSAGAGPWVVSDNRFDTVTTHVNGSAYQGVLLVGQGLPGTIHTQANAAPTTGTWAVGDHVIRQNQAVGSAKGWFCTVAGTSGTWVSEGNL